MYSSKPPDLDSSAQNPPNWQIPSLHIPIPLPESRDLVWRDLELVSDLDEIGPDLALLLSSLRECLGPSARRGGSASVEMEDELLG